MSTEPSPRLAPIDRPRGVILKLAYWFTRRQFGSVPGPLSVFSARMPLAFTSFYGKVGRLDKKLRLPMDTVVLVRERVASLNLCLFCMDASRWYATTKAPHLLPKLDALAEYRTSPLFTAAERSALDFATELTETRQVGDETFAELRRRHGEREICELAFVVASEHLYNLNNVALGIGSAGLCDAAGRTATPAAAARS